MNQDQFEALIKPLEGFAASRPEAYRFRVLLLAALGYAYLLIIVLILLSLVIALPVYMWMYGIRGINAFTIKILWIPLVLIGLVLRSLWITIPEPDGKEITREHATPLYELIDEITKSLNGPKVDHVLISDDFNAGIVQLPRFGMFGWLKNYLVVGLPLLQALSPAEFRAVLAHEFGHLSGKHGRFSGWIYRLRQTWLQILITVKQERSYASFLFEPFLNWYAPYLNAYSFVLARAQEREADDYSVELAGRETAAVTLSRLVAKERKLGEDFWPALFQQSKSQPQAPRDPFTQMLAELQQPLGYRKAQRWFFQSLRVPTGYDDTHPALVDRLAAIGYARDSKETEGLIDKLVQADEVGVSAASAFVASLPEDTLESFNRLLREQIAQAWRERHKQFQVSLNRLAALDEIARTQPLSVDEKWEKATLLADLEDPASAAPVIRTVLEDDPKHVGANFALGVILLDEDNSTGLKYLEDAMTISPEVIPEVCEVISAFHFQQGQRDLAEEFRVRGEQHRDHQTRLQDQLLKFSSSDRFGPHDLSEEALADLRAHFARVRGLAEVYIVKKFPENVADFYYVVGITASHTWRNGVSERHTEPILLDLAQNVRLPTRGAFIALEGEDFFLLDIFRRIPSALVFAQDGAGITYRV
jgi:Zn-dependent protease with chaperone function